MSEIDADNLSPPPAAPRPITKNARRRSWAEPRVRTWWLLAIVVFLVSLWFVGMRVYASQADHMAMHRGRQVDPIWDGQSVNAI